MDTELHFTSMVTTSTSPQWAWFDGKLVPFSEARIPLEDRGLQFGESLYEVVALVMGEPFRLPAHVQRMTAAAVELGIDAGVPPLPAWENLIEHLVGKERHHSALLYAQVTGGTAPRNYESPSRAVPMFFAYQRPHDFPTPAEVARGVAAVTVPDSRWLRCDLKTPMLLASVLARREALKHGADEAIFINKEGYVSDGAASSVFVVRQRTIYSIPTTRHTLPGTSTTVIREICGEVGVNFEERHLTLSDLRAAEEIFLAATSRLLMPVVRLDGAPTGSGAAGPISLQLAYHFQRLFWGGVGP